jgi:hypothetical protein
MPRGASKNSPSMTNGHSVSISKPSPEKLSAPSGALRRSPPYIIGTIQRARLGSG